MTPAARVSAAIEILDRIEAGKAPADAVIKAWGKASRFAGSGDRRAIAEHVYSALRARAVGTWAFGEGGRAAVLGSLRGQPTEDIEALFSGEGHAPAALTDDERIGLARDIAEAPDWAQAGAPPFIAQAFKERFGDDWMEEAKGLLANRAPVDLRVNALAGDVDGAVRLLGVEGIEPERSELSAWGLRLPPAFAPDIQKTRAYTTGWIEVQDQASQIAAALSGVRPGWTVVDYCAGGGGKTLALAARMHRSGSVFAFDVNPKRLGDIEERLKRARATATVRCIGPEGQGTEDLIDRCDLVFVDAPCSGSGTWRRHPEGAWRCTADTIARLSGLQLAILTRASRLVKPGGRLAYATCSVFAQENTEVAAAFAAAHPHFAPVPIAKAAATPDLTLAARTRLAELADGGHTLQMTPRRTGTDGFFIALFERSAG